MMRSILMALLAVSILTGVSVAQGPMLPDAPSVVIRPGASTMEPAIRPDSEKVTKAKVIDMQFAALAVISAGSTFADSYTTLFARENWLAGKKGVCNVEVESAYLYGTHPTVGRAYAVASAKSAVSIVTAYYLRKHHKKFWSLPLIANSAMSLQGVAQNMAACN